MWQGRSLFSSTSQRSAAGWTDVSKERRARLPRAHQGELSTWYFTHQGAHFCPCLARVPMAGMLTWQKCHYSSARSSVCE